MVFFPNGIVLIICLFFDEASRTVPPLQGSAEHIVELQISSSETWLDDHSFGELLSEIPSN